MFFFSLLFFILLPPFPQQSKGMLAASAQEKMTTSLEGLGESREWENKWLWAVLMECSEANSEEFYLPKPCLPNLNPDERIRRWCMAESVLSDGRSAMKSMIWVSTFFRKQFWFKALVLQWAFDTWHDAHWFVLLELRVFFLFLFFKKELCWYNQETL